MAVSQGLRRLLRIRALEEEQSRSAFAEAQGEVNRLKALERAAAARGRRGSRIVTESAGSPDSRDRRAGVEETRAAHHALAVLAPRIAEAEWRAAGRQKAFLECRMRKRQVETLIREAEAEDALERERKNQQALDEWFRARKMLLARAEGARERERTTGPGGEGGKA